MQGELVQYDFALPGLQQRQCIRPLAGRERGKHRGEFSVLLV